MDIIEALHAVEDARKTIEAGDSLLYQIAHLLVGRLRSSGIPRGILDRLKCELRDYDMHKRMWRAKP